VKDYRPGFPWRRGKAQLIVESGLNPGVCSAVGACGLAQFMAPTWRDVWAGKVPETQRFDAGLSIAAWGIETGRLERIWRAPRPDEDRWSLTEASYNAGPGHIIEAQRLCDMSPLFERIIACLPQITGAFAAETLNYVPRIRKTWKSLEIGQ
jgi:membrane-bound lytic murein transglycosylase F